MTDSSFDTNHLKKNLEKHLQTGLGGGALALLLVVLNSVNNVSGDTGDLKAQVAVLNAQVAGVTVSIPSNQAGIDANRLAIAQLQIRLERTERDVIELAKGKTK